MTLQKSTEKAIEEFEKVFGIVCSTCNDEGYVLVAGHAQTPHENGECDGQCPIQEQEACSCNGFGYQLKDFIRKTRREAVEETVNNIIEYVESESGKSGRREIVEYIQTNYLKEEK